MAATLKRLAWLAAAVLPMSATAQTVASLPLQRGFYVDARASCQTASNATLVLVTRDSINVARFINKFRKVEKIGPATYAVTQAATSLDGRADAPLTMTYEIPNATTFRMRKPGASLEFRYCPQASLPLPWRNNDIRDLTR